MSTDTPGPHRVAVGEEQLFVDKQVADRERVRVHTHVETRRELVADCLRSDDFTVERVPVGREIGRLPEIRREGEVLVVPVVEEEIVVTKRLILKEELRITRRVRTRRFERSVPVRRMTAVVERERLDEADDRQKETANGPDHHSSVRHQGRSRSSEGADPGLRRGR